MSEVVLWVREARRLRGVFEVRAMVWGGWLMGCGWGVKQWGLVEGGDLV